MAAHAAVIVGMYVGDKSRFIPLRWTFSQFALRTKGCKMNINRLFIAPAFPRWLQELQLLSVPLSARKLVVVRLALARRQVDTRPSAVQCL